MRIRFAAAAAVAGGTSGFARKRLRVFDEAADRDLRQSKCEGTLGLEAGPGAVVTEVYAGGPAAAAGIQPKDVVLKIGDTAIQYDCDVDKAAFNRACEPVKVVVRRGGAELDLTLTPVDQIAFLTKACIDGNPSACFRDAWLQWDRSQNAPDLFATACNGGSGEACAYQGLQLSEKSDTLSQALPVLERACELRSGSGCATLGFLYATGKSVTKDDKKATALYRKSCELGDAQGCYNAGLMADSGRGTKEDAAKAAADYEKACDLGSSTGCTNLGFLYERGRGVKEDRARAVALYQRGCDGSSCSASNLGGCVNVGRAYRDGIGVAKDAAKAAEVFRAACERRDSQHDPQGVANGARACSLLGGLLIAGDGIPEGHGARPRLLDPGLRPRRCVRLLQRGGLLQLGFGRGSREGGFVLRSRLQAGRRRELPRARGRVPERATASKRTPEWRRPSRSRPATSASRRPAPSRNRRRRRASPGRPARRPVRLGLRPRAPCAPRRAAVRPGASPRASRPEDASSAPPRERLRR